MISTDAPSFEEAKASLERFLREQGWPARVVWVFREDVTSYKKRVWVRRWEGDEAERERVAARLYELGRGKRLGVLLAAQIRFADAMGCHVWAPKDELDARYALMPRGLKLSVSTHPFEGVEVWWGLWWRFRRWRNGGRFYGNGIVAGFPGRMRFPDWGDGWGG